MYCRRVTAVVAAMVILFSSTACLPDGWDTIVDGEAVELELDRDRSRYGRNPEPELAMAGHLAVDENGLAVVNLESGELTALHPPGDSPAQVVNISADGSALVAEDIGTGVPRFSRITGDRIEEFVLPELTGSDEPLTALTVIGTTEGAITVSACREGSTVKYAAGLDPVTGSVLWRAESGRGSACLPDRVGGLLDADAVAISLGTPENPIQRVIEQRSGTVLNEWSDDFIIGSAMIRDPQVIAFDLHGNVIAWPQRESELSWLTPSCLQSGRVVSWQWGLDAGPSPVGATDARYVTLICGDSFLLLDLTNGASVPLDPTHPKAEDYGTDWIRAGRYRLSIADRVGLVGIDELEAEQRWNSDLEIPEGATVELSATRGVERQLVAATVTVHRSGSSLIESQYVQVMNPATGEVVVRTDDGFVSAQAGSELLVADQRRSKVFWVPPPQ